MRILYLLLFILFSTNLAAQTLSGIVLNENKVGVPYVSIYIKELALGTMTNDDGKFEISLSTGTYTILFYHMSYEMVTQKVDIPSPNLTINLVTKNYELPLITVGSKREDPAYAIIRKAIGSAPYYNKQLLSYKAELYVKGSATVEKISALVKLTSGKEIKRHGVKEGEKYIQENISFIEYAEKKYHQRIISETNTFPPEMNASQNLQIGMMNYNIYNSTNFDFISPISPDAFTYYQYKLEGLSQEGDHIINKIKVIPKAKNSMTLTGYIYIADDYWFVRRFELTGKNMGVQFNLRQEYGELAENIWMPISCSITADINILGNKAKASYINSIKYSDFKINPIKEGQPLAFEGKTTNNISTLRSKKAKEITREIEKIATKDELNNRDAYRIARLIQKKEKEERKSLPDSLAPKPSLDLTTSVKFDTDSLASTRDTSYWAKMRPIPLAMDEVANYKRKDSIAFERKKVESDTLLKHKKHNFLSGLLFGKRYFVGDSSLVFHHKGWLSHKQVSYNLVDGFIYGQNITIRKRFKDTTSLNFDIIGSYGFSRKNLMFKGNLQYGYYPEKQAVIYLNGGQSSMDFNEQNSNKLDNMLWTLLARQNYIRFYQDSYFSINHSIEPLNGLITFVSLSYHNKKELINHSDFSFFFKNRRVFELNNNLNNNNLSQNLLEDQTASILELRIDYTPEMYYHRWNRRKYNFRSKYPTIGFTWKKGIMNVFSSESNFNQLEFRLYQTLDLGLMKKFSYQIEVGFFPNTKQIHFSDLKHFNTKPYYISSSTYNDFFSLVPMYSMSEMKRYIYLRTSYQSPFLLLKYLPIIKNTLITEKVQLQYLNTTTNSHYSELMYGLRNIFALGELSVYVGFQKFDYQNIGIRFGLDLK